MKLFSRSSWTDSLLRDLKCQTPRLGRRRKGLLEVTPAARSVSRSYASVAMTEALEDRALLTTVLVDYSLDTNNFFDTQEKMDLFQTAVDNLAGRLTDSLAEITPSGPNTWSARFDHPGTGASHVISNPTIPADTIIIYAGGRDLPGSTIGFASSGFSAGGTSAWLDLVEGRGQSGAVTTPATDFATWGGSITFDNLNDWHFGLTTDGLDSGESDFLSVAEHELAHILGFGSDSWDAQISGGFFTGANAVAVHGGPVPVVGGHWADDTMSDGREANLTPTGTSGTRYQFTSLDFAGLEDIGWVLSDPPSEIDYGDAPDTGAGTGSGNYQTLDSDNGPSHTIVPGLFLGASVDGDDGTLQNTTATADDADGPVKDEDGVVFPERDLALVAGSQPRVNILVTNTTGEDATLSGWIDYNNDGIFDNATERVQAVVSDGTDGGIITLTFPVVPLGYFGETYARFRLSTDVGGEESTGPASDGEVEDYPARISIPGSLNAATSTPPPDEDLPFFITSDRFGFSIASLGDLDGDGIPDLAVGAPVTKTGSSYRETGAVHILFMNASGSIRESALIPTDASGGPDVPVDSRFGSSVAGVGDFDGDGVPDLAVGAPGDESQTGAISRGAVHLLMLNTDGTVKNSVKIADDVNGGPALQDLDDFGSSVAAIGDLNGDGVADLAVGAQGDSTGGNSYGAIHLLFMNADGTVNSSSKIADNTNGGPTLFDFDRFGASVAPLGDINGDGTVDIAVGARFDDTGGTSRGAVYVLMLNPDGTANDVTKIASSTNGGPSLTNFDRFGASMASLGDIDGDGITDLAVGARGNDTGGGAFTDRGAVYTVLLNSDGTVKDWSLIANEFHGGPTLAEDDAFGRGVTALGDLNGDGVTELAVSSYDKGNHGSGTFHIVYLAPAIDIGDAPDSGSGTGAGDYETSLQSGGPSHFVFGPLDSSRLFLGDTVDGFTLSPEGDRAISDDINGVERSFFEAGKSTDDEDGVLDPLDLRGTIGAAPTVTLLATNTRGIEATLSGWIDYNQDGVFDNATERAQIAVPDGSTDVRFTLTFPEIPDGSAGKTYARFRLSTDAAAANSTGAASDGEVEDYVFSITAPSRGIVEQFLRIANGTNSDLTLGDSDLFGSSVTALGDLDGDGVVDLAVGALGDNEAGSDRGAVYVLLMNTDGTVKHSTRIAHELNGGPTLSNYDIFGSSLTGLGDLDGDGVVDIAAGAAFDGAGGSRRGAVYVLLLNADGTVKKSTKIASDTNGGPTLANSDSFGKSVTLIGDVNGDGVSDLAVGADGDDTGGSRRGAVYVLLLNADGTVKSSTKIASDTNGGPTLADSDTFGDSVTTLGDLDGDGIPDLAVGAKRDDTGGYDRGAVHVLMLNADATVKLSTKIASNTNGGPSLSNGDHFGTSVAGVGDLDGDGIADVVVGAAIDDTDGADRGTIYTLLLNADGSVKATTQIASDINGGPALSDYDFFGVSISNLGDLDGDGLIELAVGADGDDTGGMSRGAVHVLFLQSAASDPQPVDLTLPGTGTYEVLRDGSDLVVRVAGGSELSRDVAANVSVLQITGSAGDDVVTVLDTGIAVDTPVVFSGGDGDDRFDASLAVGRVDLTGNSGSDTLIGGAGNDKLTGGSQADELVGGPGDDSLNGTGGTGDTLDGGDGNDTLNGGSGNDLIRESFSGDATLTNSLMTGRGTDTIISAERAMFTGGGAAQLFDLSTFFFAGLTSTILDGGGGDDTILATSGGDIISGAGGSDLIDAGGGDDRVFGGSGADTIAGGNGNDFIKGLGGSGDQLIGGAGNDTLNGGRGVDRLIESGDADFTVTNSLMTGNGTDVLLALEIAEINAGNSDNLIDVSGFLGFRGFVQVRAFGGNDTILGSAGPDVLNGGDGNDSLVGGEGDDLLNGDAGNDILQGKEGDDTLNGGDDNDGLSGFTGNDVLNGERGFDRLFGGNGNDTLTGGNARDTLFGGAGDDSLAGNDGDDTLVGGTGNNDASPGDVFDGLPSEIDEAFMLDTPAWVDQV